MDFGMSFSPLGQGNPDQKPQGAPQVQEAIRTLSLGIPRVVGGQSPIPQALLPGARGGGSQAVPTMGGVAPGAAPGGFEELLRRLFGLAPAMEGPMDGRLSPGPMQPGAPPPMAPPKTPTPIFQPIDPGARTLGESAPMAPTAPAPPSKYETEYRQVEQPF
jgi:hypothetical protein